MSVLQESGSTLVSVIGPYEELSEWQSFKLSPVKLAAQWHAKFWGKSMEDEEQEWRNAQLAMPMEGSGLGNEHWGEDESMDVDMSEEQGLDDDFIKGCYFLEIGIGSTPLRIWIRAEYISIYNVLEAHYQKPSYANRRAPVAVITGQPEIGES